MDPQLIWTERASSDIEAIVRYIAHRNPKAAGRIGLGIYDRAQILAHRGDSAKWSMSNAKWTCSLLGQVSGIPGSLRFWRLSDRAKYAEHKLGSEAFTKWRTQRAQLLSCAAWTSGNRREVETSAETRAIIATLILYGTKHPS
jgi:hypothetical protein